MKKLVSFMIALCIALTLTVPAFADGRGPTFTSFDVVCTKDTPYYRENWENDGVMEKNGTIPAGTKLTIGYEYEDDGVLYGSVQGSDNEYQEKAWDWAYIRLSDVSLRDDKFLPENSMKLSRTRTVQVIQKGGIPMYAGPNVKYDTVMTVPRGTKLTYAYANDEDDDYRTWAYVTYLNRSGWINVYRSDLSNGVAEVPEEGNTAKILVLSDGARMYDSLSEGNLLTELADEMEAEEKAYITQTPGRVTGTLKNGETYTYRYSHKDDWSGTWFYVTAGLRSGWVYMASRTKSPSVAAAATKRMQDTFLAYKTTDLTLRKTPGDETGGTRVRIEKGETITPTYWTVINYDSCYYVTIGDRSGWLDYYTANDHLATKINMESYAEGNAYVDTNETGKPIPVYSDIVSRSKTTGTIPPGQSYTELYRGSFQTTDEDGNDDWTAFYYIRCGSVTGWVDTDDLYAYDTEEPEETETETETEPETEDEWEEETRDDEDWDDEEWDDADREDEDDYAEAPVAPRNGLSPMRIVLICVGAAVVLALTAAVTLLLIRRKRKAEPPVQTAEPEAATEPEAAAEPETETAPDADTASEPDDE